jgi:hypothetical protein
MNPPVENPARLGPVDDRLIDRLVDGEVPDVERRALLLQLDAEPEGWRRCALAFLEAQSWREALNPLAGAGVARNLALPDLQGRRPRSWSRFATMTGLAASVAVAFALGWASNIKPTQTIQDASVANGAQSPPAAIDEHPQPPPVDLAIQTPGPRKSAGTLANVDPIVKTMELRGFHAQTRARLLSMQLKDGRKLEVPVREVTLRNVRNRTY